MKTNPRLWALCAGLFAATSHADRPLASETADVIAPGTCQVESALARTRAGSLDTVRAWDTLFSCGLTRQTQFALGYSRESLGGSTVQGLRAAGKTTLVAPQDSRAGFALAYGLGANRSAGMGYRIDDVGLLAVATREVAGGLLGHANLGLSHSRSTSQNTTLWSLGLETNADLSLAADLFGDDRSRPSVSAGLGYSFGANFSANASYALQFTKPQTRSVSLGAKLVF